MGDTDMDRLKADASGNTGLSETLGEAVKKFSSTEDAVRFLASRGFDVTASQLAESAAEEAWQEVPVGDQEGGYGALMRFMLKH